MADHEAAEATFHVLLIGIDNYPGHELYGCVNDIDAVQRLLVGPRMRIPPDQIRHLVSPRPDAKRTPVAGEIPATAVHIRQELDALCSKDVREGDRVFIYYAGHGKRVAVQTGDEAAFSREALVPADFEATTPSQFLFDFEIDRLLGAIAERTRSITVVLDCCHARGATRDLEGVRALPEDGVPVPDPARSTDAPRAGASHARHAGDVWQVASACLAHETAKEIEEGGVKHGVVTRAFLRALDAVPDTDLRSVTWAQIWRGMRAETTRQNPQQTPALDGYLGRAVFAGPPIHGDPGIPVVRDGDRYQIWAGEMAEIVKGVELAVYGDLPLRFPRLGSAEDRTARLGVIRVTDSTLSEAGAAPVETAFDIPPGARGRVIRAAPLPCAVMTPHPEVESALDASPLVKRAAPGEATRIRIELHDERWYLIDDQHGTGAAAPVLVSVPARDAAAVRDVLEHYHRYSLPLRVAERASKARPDGLELRLLRCPDEPGFVAAEVDVATLTDVPQGPGARYRVPAGMSVCMYVRNRTDERLQVALFDVTGDGDVQQLDDQVIEPSAFHVFWRPGHEPYRLWPADGATWSRDRLIAIGRSSRQPLDYLCVHQTFAEVLERGAGDERRMGGSTRPGGPAELWTAAQKIIEIFEP